MRTRSQLFGLAAAAVIAAGIGPLHGDGPHDVRVRRRPRLPDIPGFRTLACDLHTHIVFSDGQVWPAPRRPVSSRCSCPSA